MSLHTPEDKNFFRCQICGRVFPKNPEHDAKKEAIDNKFAIDDVLGGCGIVCTPCLLKVKETYPEYFKDLEFDEDL